MGDVVKINGEYVTDAIGFVYDGCHKIYLVFNDDDVARAKSYGYDEVYPMSKLYETFRDSCPLRFIQAFGDYHDVVMQCAKEAVFEFADGKPGKSSVDRAKPFGIISAHENRNERKTKMTQADKTEISNLLASAGTMKNLANELNAPYHDAKIAEYALSALNDAKETKAYVLSVLNNNIGMFIDLANITVRRSFGGNEINHFMQDGTFNRRIGDLLNLRIKVNNVNFSGVSPRSDAVCFSVTPKDIEVLDAWIYTSDTSLKAKDFGYDESIYHYFACTCDLYFGAYGRRSSDYVQYFDPKGKYTTKFWNHLRNCAERTKIKGDILLKELKRQISLVVSAYKAEAEKIEGFRDANTKVGVYMKIS